MSHRSARCSFVSRWDGEEDGEEVSLMAMDVGRIVSIRSELLKPSSVKGASIINNTAANNSGATMPTNPASEDPTLGAEESARLSLVIDRSCKSTPDLISFVYSITEVTLSYLRDLNAVRLLEAADAKKQQAGGDDGPWVGIAEDAAVLAEDIQLLSLALTLGTAILASGAAGRGAHHASNSSGRGGVEAQDEVVQHETQEEATSDSVIPMPDKGGLMSFEDDLELSAVGESAGVRGIVHRKLRPLQNDNTIMRNAIGFKAGEKVTAVSVASKLKSLGFGGGAGANGSVLAITDGSNAEPLVPQQQAGNSKKQKLTQKPKPSNQGDLPGQDGQHSAGAGTLNYNLDADASHSPLAWDMETESAINARTKYDPYKKRRAAGADGRQLDAVTQQQLVSRLHDKSVDLREKRKKDNDEMMKRELGCHERRVLSSEEQTELGARLHDRWGAHTKEAKEQLKQRYLRPLSPETKLDQETQKGMALRLHDECRAKTKTDMEKLHTRYVTDMDGPKVRLSKEQQKEMAERLSVYNVRDYNNS